MNNSTATAATATESTLSAATTASDDEHIHSDRARQFEDAGPCKGVNRVVGVRSHGPTCG